MSRSLSQNKSPVKLFPRGHMDDLFIITIAGRQLLKGKKISTLNLKKKKNSSPNRGKFYYVACAGALRTL